MSSPIFGNMIGGTAPIKTVKLIDENNNEVIGVVTGSEVVFTATDNDVREGSVYASDNGVSTGTKFIPPYYVGYGHKIVFANQEAKITTPEYDYQSLLITIATYDTSWSQSTVLTYVSVDNAVYSMVDNSKISDIAINHEAGMVDLGITVNEKSILRYFIVREEF